VAKIEVTLTVEAECVYGAIEEVLRNNPLLIHSISGKSDKPSDTVIMEFSVPCNSGEILRGLFPFKPPFSCERFSEVNYINSIQLDDDAYVEETSNKGWYRKFEKPNKRKNY